MLSSSNDESKRKSFIQASDLENIAQDLITRKKLQELLFRSHKSGVKTERRKTLINALSKQNLNSIDSVLQTEISKQVSNQMVNFFKYK